MPWIEVQDPHGKAHSDLNVMPKCHLSYQFPQQNTSFQNYHWMEVTKLAKTTSWTLQNVMPFSFSVDKTILVKIYVIDIAYCLLF